MQTADVEEERGNRKIIAGNDIILNWQKIQFYLRELQIESEMKAYKNENKFNLIKIYHPRVSHFYDS